MKQSFLSGIFILLFAGLISIQLFSDSDKSRAAYTEPIVFKSDIVKIADLGLHSATSDLMWLAGIQYFGGGESATYEKLDDYLYLSTELDPQFTYPYAFGSLVLPSFGQIDKGLALGQKGIDNGVEDYRIPYYMATTYFINKNDNENAAKYFDLAANTPGAPDGTKKVAATFGSRADKREKTKQIWIDIYNNSKDEVVKERAKNYVIHIQILDFLEEAAKQYNTVYGKYPATPEDLVNGKILTGIPTDPFGFEYTFGENGLAKIK